MNDNKYSESISSDGNSQEFVFDRMLGEYAFIDLVEVIDVTDKAVTVKSLILERDNGGKGIESQPVYDIPYLRLQGGRNAVKLAPSQGDVGIMAVCDKDISQIKRSLKSSIPSSERMHSKVDGIYITTIRSLNSEPIQVIDFNDDGIDIKSPKRISINGLEILPDGRLKLVSGVIIDTHVHGGVQSGGDSSGGPQ